MCQHGSGFVLFFIARGLGSKYSAVSSISICDDRVDMNWVCTKAWAQPILQHAVHLIQGAKINYRSLEKNNNPPLLFPSSRLFLFTAQEHPEEPIGHTTPCRLRCDTHTEGAIESLSQTGSSYGSSYFCTSSFVLFLFAETLSVDKRMQKNGLGFHFLLQTKQKEQ